MNPARTMRIVGASGQNNQKRIPVCQYPGCETSAVTELGKGNTQRNNSADWVQLCSLHRAQDDIERLVFYRGIEFWQPRRYKGVE